MATQRFHSDKTVQSEVLRSRVRHRDGEMAIQDSPSSIPHSASIRARRRALVRLASRERATRGSNPVAPTILRNEPFGEYVEGLFHCEDASYRSTSVFKWSKSQGKVTELLCLFGET
jgi:hypothetical protein